MNFIKFSISYSLEFLSMIAIKPLRIINMELSNYY